MNVLALPRTAVDGYLKLVRLPLDRAIALLPGDETGRQQADARAKARREQAARRREQETRRAAKAEDHVSRAAARRPRAPRRPSMAGRRRSSSRH